MKRLCNNCGNPACTSTGEPCGAWLPTLKYVDDLESKIRKIADFVAEREAKAKSVVVRTELNKITAKIEAYVRDDVD